MSPHLVPDGPGRRRRTDQPALLPASSCGLTFTGVRRELLEVSMGLEVLLTTLRAKPHGLSPSEITLVATALDEALDGLSAVGEKLA